MAKALSLRGPSGIRRQTYAGVGRPFGPEAGGFPRRADRQFTSLRTTSKTLAASIRMGGLVATIAARERAQWTRTSKRMSSSPSMRPSAARCETQLENRARAVVGPQTAGANRPARPPVVRRARRLPSPVRAPPRSATGSYPSSAMTWWTAASGNGASSRESQNLLAIPRPQRPEPSECQHPRPGHRSGPPVALVPRGWPDRTLGLAASCESLRPGQ